MKWAKVGHTEIIGDRKKMPGAARWGICVSSGTSGQHADGDLALSGAEPDETLPNHRAKITVAGE